MWGPCFSIDLEVLGSASFSVLTIITVSTSNAGTVPDLGGGFKHFLFSPLLGEDCHFD